ncbi:MAG: PQQ-binding-like beta-propeller repeat protein [Planctomycetota bacterium]
MWREKGIVERFPVEGLKVQWRVPVALGYAGPAVADGRVYVIDYVREAGEIKNNPGGRDKLEGKERILCFDAASGTILWKHEYDRPYNISYGGGPRCTPTVADGRVYALGAEGNLWCLNVENGQVLWSVDFDRDYGAPTPLWGVAGHPLVAGDLVYCVVGGEGSVAVAFNKSTGREVWRALSAGEPGYCPPTMIEHAGTEQLVVWHAEEVNALDPRTGLVYWTVPLKPRFGMSIATPRKLGSHLLVTGYGEGALLKLDDSRPGAEVVWRARPKTAIFCANSTPFLEGEMIYGCDIESGALMGVRLEDGERLWQTRQPTAGGDRPQRYGTAFLVKHEDRFFLFSEQGDLILARLSPRGYDEISRFHVLEPTNATFGRPVVWSHPAFASRCVFARNDKELVCVSLAADD